MKKWMFLLLALCICAGLFLSAPQAQAAEHTDHCVCGDNAKAVGDHAQCEEIQWEPVTISNKTISVANGGHYYLTGNTSASLTVKDNNTVTLCLNGFYLRAQCPIQVYGNGVLNICDCQGTGTIRATNPANAKGTTVLISSAETAIGTVNMYGGTINGDTTTAIDCRAVEVKGGIFNMYGGQLENGISDGSCSTDTDPGYGGNVYVYNNAGQTGKFTLYGGTIRGGQASKYGGNIYAAKDSELSILGGTIENGSAGNGGNIHATEAAFHMENAVVTGGKATNARANLYVSKPVDLSCNTISGGTVAGVPETVRIIRNGHYLSTDHTTLDAAVTKMNNDSNKGTLSIQLLGDHSENYTIASPLTLDMNGHDLSGVTVTGQLTVSDSKTDTYQGDLAGHLSYTAEGGSVAAAEHYLAIEDETGISFHKYYVGITSLTLNPAKAGMGYKATFCGDEAIKNYLSDSMAYGYQLWLDGYYKVNRGYSADKFGGMLVLSLSLNNILTEDNDLQTNLENADWNIHAQAYIRLSNGQQLTSSVATYNLKTIVHLADNQYDSYTTAQQNALQTMGGKYSDTMFYWDVENIHHADGKLWTQVGQQDFLDMMKKGTSKYTLPSGNYVLTEDVDIGDRQIYLHNTVTICLNGYTLTGSQQIFDMVGNLTICDCHETDDEGGIHSTYTTTDNLYAPVAHIRKGTMNLYGGNLTAGGEVRSAGVIGVGDTSGTNKVVFNMYGGSISGGIARYNGGLLTVWNGSTFNMYDGKLYGGSCVGETDNSSSGNGGGIVIREEGVVNLYRGQIYHCSAANNGGGIWAIKGAKLYIGDVDIYDNTATGKGGNIYNNSTADFCLDGTTVTGGSAAEGGGLYQQEGSVSTMGSTCIYNNQNGDLRMNYYGTLNADGLTEGASINVSAVIHGKIGTEPSIAQYVTCTDEGYTIKQNNGDMVLWNGNLTQAQTINQFSAGYGRVNITPRDEEGNLLPVPLAGYGDTEHRLAETVDADIYVTATAITDESGRTVLLMAADLSGLSDATLAQYIPHISYMTGVPQGDIIITCSHTHSAPAITSSLPIIVQYKQTLPDLFAQAAIDAMNDRQAATMETGSFEVTGGKNNSGLNFTRHYKYQDADGNWLYSCDNFGERDLDNQINAQHVTQADPTMYLVKLAREEGKDILMINWRAHPTMTGGTTQTVLSSDYVGALRDVMDVQTDMSMIFFQGAAGNINATSRLSWEKHGYTFREYGQVLNDQIVAAMDGGCMTETEPGLWQVDNHTYTATVNHTDDDRLEEAQAFVEEYYETFPGNQESQSVRLAWCAERGWTCVFEASSIVRRAGLGETAQMSLNALSLGDSLGFYTAPGELFDTVSVEMESASPFDMTICLGYSMGTHKYFAYDPNNGGAMTYDSYEGFNSNYLAPDTINDMIAYWKEALKALHSGAQ